MVEYRMESEKFAGLSLMGQSPEGHFRFLQRMGVRWDASFATRGGVRRALGRHETVERDMKHTRGIRLSE